MDFSANKFVQDNIASLEAQEKELLKLLDVVRKAKELFLKAGSNAAAAIGSSTKSSKKTAIDSGIETDTKTAKQKKKVKTSKRSYRKSGGVSYKEKIIEILRSRGTSLTSKEIIDALFENESGIDYETFKKNIYPVLSKAYKNKDLVNNNGQISLP